jgi:ATP-binding cassette, subfamily B, bacterial PglK
MVKMLKRVKQSLFLLTLPEKVSILTFGIVRTLLGLLDILGMIFIGIILAKATNNFSGDQLNSGRFPAILEYLTSLALTKIAVIALSIFILKSILAILVMKLMTQQFAAAETRIATKLYSNFLHLHITEISRRSKPDYVFSLTSAASFGITGLLNAAVVITSEVFLLIAITVTFAVVNLKITSIVLLYFFILAIVINKTVGLGLQKSGNRSASSSLASSSTVEDSIGAYREIYALGKQDEFEKQFNKTRSETSQANAMGTFLFGLPRHLAETSLLVGIAGLIFLTFRSGNATEGASLLGIFITGSFRIMASMLPLQGAIGELRHISAQADRFFELVEDYFFIKQNNSTVSKFNVQKLGNTSAIGLDINNVFYRYPGSDSDALKNISLQINPGEFVAFIGPSGSGKSTLADLIVNLIEPNSGFIHIHNSGQKSIGYVPQAPGMITGTIRQNISMTFESKEIDDKKIMNSIEQAHLAEFIESLPNGIETHLGAQADSLSGGQMQRIGLARALYSDPGLLVLDEATSALDADTEAAIAESINKLHGGCTVIVVAHRLSTIQNADKVFVFSDGKMEAQGKFSELAKSNKLVSRYIELLNIQQSH